MQIMTLQPAQADITIFTYSIKINIYKSTVTVLFILSNIVYKNLVLDFALCYYNYIIYKKIGETYGFFCFKTKFN